MRAVQEVLYGYYTSMHCATTLNQLSTAGGSSKRNDVVPEVASVCSVCSQRLLHARDWYYPSARALVSHILAWLKHQTITSRRLIGYSMGKAQLFFWPFTQ